MKNYIYIISEYNPPHKGHAYMIDEIRKNYADATVIAIMSGNFVERGSPAIINRFARALGTLSIGADLVLSLPFPRSMSSAEYFARGGVHIAASLAKAFPDGCHTLAFGSECGDTELIKTVGRRLADPDFRRELYGLDAEHHNARGISAFYSERFPDGSGALLSRPNDTLAVEYVRAIAELDAPLSVYAVKRIGSGHDSDEDEEYLSASAVRERIYTGGSASDALPSAVSAIVSAEIEKYGAACEENYGDAILSALRRYSPEDISAIAECGGGVGGRLISAAKKASSYSELLSLAKTKQYTNARLRRAAVFAYLGVRRDALAALPRYTQLLAANSRGTAALRGFVRYSDIEVLTKAANHDKLSSEASCQYLLEASADDLYTLAFMPHLPSDAFLRSSPHIIT